MQFGANAGYVTWLFRPVAGGIWADVADDETLGPDGSRVPTCPLLPAPPSQEAGTMIYRFGRSGSGVLH
jgi:hypothetical protein